MSAAAWRLPCMLLAMWPFFTWLTVDIQKPVDETLRGANT